MKRIPSSRWRSRARWREVECVFWACVCGLVWLVLVAQWFRVTG